MLKRLNPRSLRVRLTLWYSCALILLALVLAGASRWAMAVSLDHALDQSLRYRLIGLRGFIDENSREGLERLTARLGGLDHLGELFQVFGPHGELMAQSDGLARHHVSTQLPPDPGAGILYRSAGPPWFPVRMATQRIYVGGQPLIIEVADPQRKFQGVLNEFYAVLYIALPIALVIAAFGGYWLSRRALSPVDQIIDEACAITWSPDGKHVVYEKVDYSPRPQNQLLYSWDPDYEYRYTDVFPSFSKDGTLLLTNKDVDSSIVTMDADDQNKRVVYKALDGVAFAPSWSPDGEWIAFGFGSFLQGRRSGAGKIMLVRRDGTGVQDLTSGMPNAGFPNWSLHGNEIVYRSWGANEMGLRIPNVRDHSVRVLTNGSDNLPDWSPDSSRILFTRSQDGNFDIYTIKPDGTDACRMTTFPANDAHAVWTQDGKYILWNSGEYGFKDEAALYDNSFQPYGSIWIMKADGSDKRQLTDSHWEDAMPCFVPKSAARQTEGVVLP
jgi:Tol biopolymer transport system component